MKMSGKNVQDNNLFMALDKGIEDVEDGRELPLDDAFIMIEKLSKNRKQPRSFDDYFAEQMQDDVFRRKYDSMKPEFDEIRTFINDAVAFYTD
ncbi:MAG: hypothetical protein IJ397_02910 [Lachnospiraceae bacterium]|nr:hypothetical protein [Lachnospiraceae bacterium]